MDSRVALVLIVAVATILAGCSWVERPEPAGPAAGNTTGTDDGPSIPYDRLAAHADALRDRGYELRLDVRIRTPNGSENRTVSVASAPDSERQLIHRRTTDSTLDRFVDGAQLFTRFVANGSTTFDSADLGAENVTFTTDGRGTVAFVNTVHGSSLRTQRLRQVYEFGEFERAGNVTRDGREYAAFDLTAAATGPNATVTLNHSSGRILIAPNGVIRRATIDLQGTQRGAPFVYAVDYRITQDGDVSVQPPEWLDRAGTSENTTANGPQTTSASG
ncbi:DUF7537 family lipoprotein [Halorientalis pallida]|uniref:Uncharacterized protein n=1 Tax=Halorientalis pallida TaxID=2479928 RepID=A0A498L1V8_9EURY|nr:hypothetical protein [Halorientalis pallida]RXK49341.1 hypothetical protein EAF64_10505 [Halorientalis pallida]